MYSSVEIGILVVIVYICIFGIVNRICKCIEACTVAKYRPDMIDDAMNNKK